MHTSLDSLTTVGSVRAMRIFRFVATALQDMSANLHANTLLLNWIRPGTEH